MRTGTKSQNTADCHLSVWRSHCSCFSLKKREDVPVRNCLQLELSSLTLLAEQVIFTSSQHLDGGDAREPWPI